MARYPGAVQRQLQQYDVRVIRPWILSVLHITDNPAVPEIMQASEEITWRMQDLSVRNSATFFINPDGAPWQALDPKTQVAWTNGDVSNPDTSRAGIARLVRAGINGNAACYFTAEAVGNERRGLPVTDAQLRTFGALNRFYSRESGIPINTDTIYAHRFFNRIGRYNCPTRGNVDALLGRAISYSGVVPNTSVPKGRDLYEWVATMKHQIPKKAIVRKGTVLYKDKVGGVKHYTLLENTEIEVLGGTPGGWASRRKGGTGLFITPGGGILKWMPW